MTDSVRLATEAQLQCFDAAYERYRDSIESCDLQEKAVPLPMLLCEECENNKTPF